MSWLELLKQSHVIDQTGPERSIVQFTGDFRNPASPIFTCVQHISCIYKSCFLLLGFRDSVAVQAAAALICDIEPNNFQHLVTKHCRICFFSATLCVLLRLVQ